MDSKSKAEDAVAGIEPETDTKTMKRDMSPSTDGTDRKATAPVTASVSVTTSANGSSVVFPHQNGSSQGSHLNNDSYTNYMARNNPYMNGSYMGYDGQPYDSPYGHEACHSRDLRYMENPISGPQNSNRSTPARTNASGAVRLPFNSHPRAFGLQNKGKLAAGHFPRFSSPKQGHVPYNDYVNENSNGNFWVQKHHYSKPDKNEKSDDAAVELTVGPRTNGKNPPSESSSKKDNLFGLTIRRELFNLPDFQTEYEDAKFYVIKSYSEDDIHKSIKYSVWSSTPNGNKKLDAAFREAEEKSRGDGKNRPVFLFFSVNASRQFVGLAEMVGYVDFDKDLDFWQVDKWIGFFPVQWHIVKDIPNRELRHITLDNNEDKPVTHTRDTHEIKLREGLRMLTIFKKYSAGTSLLDDDMDFYEEREKALRAKKENKPATLRMDFYKDSDFDNEIEEEDRRRTRGGREDGRARTQASLIDRTKNLSLTGRPTSEKYGVKNVRGST
ncbi:PREDICTED: uncharacterized protein LOC104823697 [Tarenaya hassleriana]|uniref:uncharacterized protein LOC104823697 n=1 Tax=Tarenaya hassleriana TaxID=28532 RepID=UPI00053C98CD|nr:PREDICTED: uncharacterized protein LOC104823697 [Tarenaya hassleriana]XP_010553684.1 PREDICTED: uncharacterized protein LOC104823697 [Tarenaya hassleriana]